MEGISLGKVLKSRSGLDFMPVRKNKIIKEDNVPIIDSDWVRSRFMVSGNDLSDLDKKNRFFTTTHWKFTDSSLGGNIAVNARPQFTRYADIRHGGRIAYNPVTVNSTSGKHGMGRYYSESIDDNATTIYMEFGLPRFNSLISYFTRAVDGVDSYIARHGRKPSDLMGYAKTAGNVAAFIFFPLTSALILTTKFLASAITLTEHLFNFYYFESAMHMYWGAVNTITTVICTELGMVIPQVDTYNSHNGSTAKRIGTPAHFDQEHLRSLRNLFPSIVWDNNYIDVFAIATRAQRIANAMLLEEFRLYSSGNLSDKDFYGYVAKLAPDMNQQKEYKSQGSTLMEKINYYTSFNQFLNKTVRNKDSIYNMKEEELKPEDKAAGAASGTEENSPEALKAKANSALSDSQSYKNMPVKDSDGSYSEQSVPIGENERTYLEKYLSTVDAAARDGGLYVCFNVDYQGPVSESFSNSVGNIAVGDTVKSVAKGVHDMRFNLAEGNIAKGINEVVNTSVSVLTGLLEGVTFGFSNVILTLLSGFVDIPKKWEDSQANFPQITYKTRLVSPYANPVSQFQNIYLPLACLLAGTLPLAAGKASYQSPFLCTLFNKGVQNIKLGMITSLSIERGTSNLGFTKNKKALAIDVSFTVTDFSELLTTPVNRTTFEEVFSVSLEDDQPLNRYLATVASRDILTNKYALPKIKLALSRKLMGASQMISPHSWGLLSGEKLNSLLGPIVIDRGTNQNQNNFLF